MNVRNYDLDQGGNVELMRKVITAQGNRPDWEILQSVFRFLKPGDNLETIVDDIGNWAYQMAYFDPDYQVQTIRTKEAFQNHRKANCVDYTVMIASIAKMVGLKTDICLVDETGEGFTHVVPLIEGIVCDVVPLQIQDGTEIETRTKKNPYITPIKSVPDGSKTLTFTV